MLKLIQTWNASIVVEPVSEGIVRASSKCLIKISGGGELPLSLIPLETLAGLNLSEAGEQTIREKLITPLLSHLGYDEDKDYEVLRSGDKNTSFAIQLPTVHSGSKRSSRISPDYLPTVRKKFFWVMDAKRPSSDIPKTYVAQVLQYALHPEIQVRYAVMINGIVIDVYDVKAEFFNMERKVYEPVLRLKISEIDARFQELKSVLGNEEIRRLLVNDLESDFLKICSVSLYRLGLGVG
jgi:predicted type IV restriction endonuclease